MRQPRAAHSPKRSAGHHRDMTPLMGERGYTGWGKGPPLAGTAY